MLNADRGLREGEAPAEPRTAHDSPLSMTYEAMVARLWSPRQSRVFGVGKCRQFLRGHEFN